MKMNVYKKKIVQFCGCLLLAVSILLTNVSSISAASFGLRASASTIYYGNTFTVTVNASNGAGYIDLSCSNGTLSTYSIWLDNSSSTISVTPKGVGTVTVYANGVIADYNSGLDESKSASVSVNVISRPVYNPNNGGSSSGGTTSEGNVQVTPEEEEVDVTLKSLSVSEGKLDPSFNANQHEYEVVVNDKVNKVEIKAEASDSNAKVEGIGEITLKEKETKAVVKVLNEGEMEEYTITFIKETPVVTIDDLGILNEHRDAPILKGFEDHKITINKVEVNAKKNIQNNIVVVYAIDKEGKKGYYIYNEGKKTITSIYRPISLLGKNYVMVDIPKRFKDMNGLKFGKVKIEESEFEGWTFKDKTFKNYLLIYLMDESGAENLYQYEATQKTLQLYDGSAIITTQEYKDLKEELKMYQMFTYVLAATSGIIGVSALTLAISVKKKRRK